MFKNTLISFLKGFLGASFTCLLLIYSSGSFAQIATGTGFFINSQGYLVTNYHVIQDGKAFTLFDIDRNEYQARVVAVDPVNDLAILKTDQLPRKFISIVNSNSVKLGDKVFTLGFPNVVDQGVLIKFTDGSISSLAGAKDLPSLFQISVPIQPGNSGGPLLDSSGSLVGVIRAKLKREVALRSTGQLPENVNYAVKSNYLVELLRSSRINFVEANSKSTSNRSSAASSESIEQAVVLIVVHSSSTVDFGVNSIKVSREYSEDYPDSSPKKPKSLSAPKQKEVTETQKTIPAAAIEWNAKSIDSASSSNWVEAIRTAAAAINVDPTYDDAYANRCRAYIGYGDLAAAKKDCDTALKINPNNLVAKNNLGVIELTKGNKAAALKIYEENCKNGFDLSCQNYKRTEGYSPNKPEEFVKLKLDESKKLFNDKNWNGVVSVTTEIIKVSPSTSDAYTTRSGAYANLGKINEGIADAEMAIKLNPDDAVAYNNLGYLYEMQKNKPQAILQYEIGCGLKSQLACDNLKRLKH